MLRANPVESMFIATRRSHLCDVCITSPVYRVFRLVLYTSRLSSYSLTALGSVVLVQQIQTDERYSVLGLQQMNDTSN